MWSYMYDSFLPVSAFEQDKKSGMFTNTSNQTEMFVTSNKFLKIQWGMGLECLKMHWTT